MGLHLPTQLHDLGIQHGDHRDQCLDRGGVRVGHDLGLDQMLGTQRGLNHRGLLRDIFPVCPREHGTDLRQRQPGSLRRGRGLHQQLQRVSGVEVLERVQRGREVIPQRVPQPLSVASAFPDQGFMGAGHHFDRLGPRRVARDRAQLMRMRTDHVGQHMRIPSIAFSARHPQSTPEIRNLQRIDRHDRVTGRDQRRHPRATIGLNPDHHLHILIGIFTDPLADHRVQPGHPGHTLRQPGLGQPTPRTLHQLDVVMVLSPVIPDEQSHRFSVPQPSTGTAAGGRPSAT